MSTSKIPAGVTEATRLKCAEIIAAFPGITHVYGYAAAPSDHVNRRCIDFMVPTRQLGDQVAAYVKANAVRLGVNGQVWYRQVMGFPHVTNPPYRGPSGTWRRYTGTSNPHTDHVHVEFDTTIYRPAATNPLAGVVWLDRLRPGVTDSDSVRLLERALGLPETGDYTDTVTAAVRLRQRSWGDDPVNIDGILGPKGAALVFAEARMRVDLRTDPSGQTPTPAPKPEDPAMPKARLTITGLNVLRRTDPEAGKRRLPWGKRLPGIIAVLKSTIPDLVLLQELDQQTAADIAGGLGNGWAYHRKNGIGIMWLQSVLERTGEPVAKLYSDRDNRYVTGVPLRHKATGRTFTAWVTHLENDGDTATDGHAARRLQTREFVTFTGNGDAVMGGDLNSTTPVLVNPTARQTEKPRPILAKAGWVLLSQLRTSASKVANGMLESHWGGRATDNITNGPWIDDLGVRGHIKLLGGALVRTDRTRCSDHHALTMRVELN